MDTFSYHTWAIDFEKNEIQDKKFYVRLERRSRWNYKLLWRVDYQRFETYQQAQSYLETLPDPEVSAKWEGEVFKFCELIDYDGMKYSLVIPKPNKTKKKVTKK